MGGGVGGELKWMQPECDGGLEACSLGLALLERAGAEVNQEHEQQTRLLTQISFALTTHFALVWPL